MQIVKVSIPKEAFDRIPESERGFIVALGYLANELNVLNKLLLAAMQSRGAGEPEERAATLQVGFVMRLLAGHLKEGWSLLQRAFWGGAVSKDYEALLSPSAGEALDRIKRYFSGSNLIDTIRSTYAFHIPVTELKLAASTFSDGEDFEMYFAEANGNCLFWGAEVLAMWGFIGEAGSGDEVVGINRYFAEVAGISKDYSAFSNSCIAVFAVRCGATDHEEWRTELTLDGVQDTDSLRLPFFVDRSRGR